MSDNVVAFARPESPDLSKAAKLRALLDSPDLEFIMEAHNGLSAKVAEEAGFKGLWASGLSISTALGVRDRNEASWTQVLEVLEFMSDATDVPILLDGDTGYGDFNNFRRLVQKLCQRDIAAVCIEDKTFPKTNSFLDGDQSLADVEEFCGKIKAGKDSQTDENFSIVARVEALIAGWGMDEALRPGGGLSRRRRRRNSDPFETARGGRDPDIRQRVGSALPAGDRPDHLLRHADQPLSGRRDFVGNLGESQPSDLDHGDAQDQPADLRAGNPDRRGRRYRHPAGRVRHRRQQRAG